MVHPSRKFSGWNWLGSRLGLESTSDEGYTEAKTIQIKGYSIIRPNALINTYAAAFCHFFFFFISILLSVIIIQESFLQEMQNQCRSCDHYQKRPG